jgi:hypothetical protein
MIEEPFDSEASTPEAGVTKGPSLPELSIGFQMNQSRTGNDVG